MKYFLGFIFSIGLIVLVFVLILKGFSGGKSAPTQAPLSDYAKTDAVVRFTTDGPIVAEQEHGAYRITVGKDETRVEALKGYEYNILDQRTYANNQESYFSFLRALDFAGFTKGTTKDTSKDERGACADGERYIVEILDGSSKVQRYWASECRGQGTFKGNISAVRQLFIKQIPSADFSKVTSGVKF